jgi:hypothetical protein
MTIPNFSPKFVKSKISFEIDGVTHNIGEHLINAQGVPGFNWDKFKPQDYIGKKVIVFIDLLTENPVKIKCFGFLNYEATDVKTLLGITLALDEQQKKVLNLAIEKEGVLPEYIRKFPRINFDERINIMPKHALMYYKLGNENILSVAQIDNLSPNGFQITTEDARANALVAGLDIPIELMPRGENYTTIKFIGSLKRSIISVDPLTLNFKYSFGMAINQIKQEDKANFISLLKKMLEIIQTKNLTQ